MLAHTHMHMSPAQAAKVSGVSRWTIMRAIKAHELQAIRDNRNQWKITAEDLAQWQQHSVRTPDVLHAAHSPEIVIELRERLAAETARANAAEADRDRWQALAEKLTDRPGWWAWLRRR